MTTKTMVRIGKEKESGKVFSIDLARVNHLTATASSQYGKTTLLRRLLEVALSLPEDDRPGVVIFDIEGEFSTMREVADFAIVGPEGEAPVDARSAPELARLVVEHGVNLIVDLSEEDVKEQDAFIAGFSRALLKLPRELWRWIILVVDEAHEFAPQKERKGKSTTAKDALVALAARGAKRDIQVWWATQRLAKFEKDITAESNLKIVGRQNDKSDRKRAGDDIEDYVREDLEDGAEPRDWGRAFTEPEPGDFWVYGGAIEGDPVLVHADLPKTEGPGKGANRKPAPPPRTKMKKLLEQIFAELPVRVDENDPQKMRATVSQLRARVRELEHGEKRPAAASARENAPATKKETHAAVVEALKPWREDVRRLQHDLATEQSEHEKLRREADKEKTQLAAAFDQERETLETRAAAEEERSRQLLEILGRTQSSLLDASSHLLDKVQEVAKDGGHKRALAQLEKARERAREVAPLLAPRPPLARPAPPPLRSAMSTTTSARSSRAPAGPRGPVVPSKESTLPASLQVVVDRIAELATYGISPAPRVQLAAWANIALRTLVDRQAALRDQGLVETAGGGLRLTREGEAIASAPPPATTYWELRQRLAAASVVGETRLQLLDAIVNAMPEGISRADLAEAASIALRTVHDRLPALHAAGLIERDSTIRASSLVMLEDPTSGTTAAPRRVSRPSASPTQARKARGDVDASSLKVKAGAREMLRVLAVHHPRELTRTQAALGAGISQVGTLSSYVSTLNRAGLVEPRGEKLAITKAGLDYVQGDALERPQTVEELQQMWRKHLKAGAQTMFDVLVATYPDHVSREDLKEKASIAAEGTFSSYLSTLRRLELIVDGRGGEVRANPQLFELAESA